MPEEKGQLDPLHLPREIEGDEYIYLFIYSTAPTHEPVPPTVMGPPILIHLTYITPHRSAQSLT